jgi:hypothetical protein
MVSDNGLGRVRTVHTYRMTICMVPSLLSTPYIHCLHVQVHRHTHTHTKGLANPTYDTNVSVSIRILERTHTCTGTNTGTYTGTHTQKYTCAGVYTQTHTHVYNVYMQIHTNTKAYAPPPLCTYAPNPSRGSGRVFSATWLSCVQLIPGW